MNNFLKTTLAVVLGIIIASILSIVITFVFVGAAASSGSSKPVVHPNSVLKISDVTITEQSQEANPFENVQAIMSSGIDMNGTVGIWDAVQAINRAANDPAINFIYLKPDGILAGQSAVEELRSALDHFRASGKPIISLIENPGTGSYYLASVADKVYMPEYIGQTYMFTGVSTQLIFLKDLLDKVGINIQLIRHGKYKSAGEMFIRNEASEANLEQNQVMVNSMWSHYSGVIAASRGISTAALNADLDSLKLCEPQDFVDCGLVDELLTTEQMKEKLADLAVEKSYGDVKMVTFRDYVQAGKSSSVHTGDKLAVIYADGEIVDGDGKDQVAGDYFASQIAKVRADSSIKAVVLRVNSPGGSVTASAKIKDEIDLLRKVKPVVASYGDYAASGGYWISNSCDKVYSDATTLTGSIGVFGIVPDASKAIKETAHINIQTVGSNRHGDLLMPFRPLDAQEYAYMQRSIESIYDAFLANVSAGRGMTPEQVDEIAQGRVWTGSDALEIGLVDEIGTLEDAIRFTAAGMGVEDISKLNIVAYPKQATIAEQLLSSFGQDPEQEELVKIRKALSRPQIVARMPYQYIFN